MNIAFLCEYPTVPSFGGIERVTSIIAQKLKELGHKVIFIASKDFPPFFYNPQYLEGQKILSSDKNLALNQLREILIVDNINVIISQQLIDINHFFFTHIGDLNVKRISVMHNQPFNLIGKERLIKRHTPNYNLKTKGMLLKYLGITFPRLFRSLSLWDTRRLYNKHFGISDKIFLLSEKFIPRVEKFMPEIDKNKLDYINNPNTFEKNITSSENKENILLFVGRLDDPQKNVRGFIDIWKEFHKHHPEWKAIIVGDGQHRHLFESYARTKKVKNLNFIGNQKNVAEYYGRSKAICVTSLYEGWGMVIVEAMAYGCIPLVYNTYEAVFDIINNEETGYIIEPFKIDVMVNKLSEIADNEFLRKEMSENCKSHIDNFKADVIGKIWDKKLRELVKSE